MRIVEKLKEILQRVKNGIGLYLFEYATCDHCGNTLWFTNDHTNPYLIESCARGASKSVCDKCFQHWKVETREVE